MATAARALLRNPTSKIVLALSSIIVSLVIVEVALRGLGYQPRRPPTNNQLQTWASQHAETGWINRPGTSHSTEAGRVAMHFEPDGRRSDPAGHKPESLPRVLVVGCSYTQGYGIADDQTYSHLINESLPSAELLNYGTGGYGSYQSLLRIRSYFKSPHAKTPLVIYGLFHGHPARDVAPLAWILSLTTQDGRYLVPPNVRQERSGRFAENPGGPIDIWPLEQQTAIVALLHQVVVNRAPRRVTPAMADAVFRHLIVEMNNTVADNNAALLVIGLTAMPDWAASWMREHGVDFVPCHHPDFGKDPALQVGGIGHPNERVHRWWAACALKALAERGHAAAAEPNELQTTRNETTP